MQYKYIHRAGCDLTILQQCGCLLLITCKVNERNNAGLHKAVLYFFLEDFFIETLVKDCHSFFGFLYGHLEAAKAVNTNILYDHHKAI